MCSFKEFALDSTKSKYINAKGVCLSVVTYQHHAKMAEYIKKLPIETHPYFAGAITWAH